MVLSDSPDAAPHPLLQPYKVFTNFGNGNSIQVTEIQKGVFGYKFEQDPISDGYEFYIETLDDIQRINPSLNGQGQFILDTSEFLEAGHTLHILTRDGEYASLSTGNPHAPEQVVTSVEPNHFMEFFFENSSIKRESSQKKSGELRETLIAMHRHVEYFKKESNYGDISYATSFNKLINVLELSLNEEKMQSLKASLADFAHFVRADGDWKAFETYREVKSENIINNRPLNEASTWGNRRLNEILENPEVRALFDEQQEDKLNVNTLNVEEKILLAMLHHEIEDTSIFAYMEADPDFSPRLYHSNGNITHEYLKKILPEVNSHWVRKYFVRSSIIALTGSILGLLSPQISHDPKTLEESMTITTMLGIFPAEMLYIMLQMFFLDDSKRHNLNKLIEKRDKAQVKEEAKVQTTKRSLVLSEDESLSAPPRLLNQTEEGPDDASVNPNNSYQTTNGTSTNE